MHQPSVQVCSTCCLCKSAVPASPTNAAEQGTMSHMQSEVLVCRLAPGDPNNGLASHTRSMGSERLSFRPAERSPAGSRPRPAAPLGDTEAGHPHQQVRSPCRLFPGQVSESWMPEGSPVLDQSISSSLMC